MQEKLATFIAETTGKVVDYDGVAANAGQCVQLVEIWCQALGTPVEWHNAADWFYDYGGAFAASWDKVTNDPSNPNQTPLPGDIVVFSKSLPGSSGYGHIDIFVRNITTTTWVGFDSNWSGKQAQQITHNWSYVLGWFTPKFSIAPPPTYTLSVAPFSGTYTVHGNKWNLDAPNFDAIVSGAVAGAPSEPLTFTALLARSDLPQYTYYLEDGNIHQGYNALDCTLYVPPAPVYTPPAGPVTVPVVTFDYMLLVNVPGYPNAAANARDHSGTSVTLNPGKYLQYTTSSDGMIYVGRDGLTSKYWINPADNVEKEPDPVVEPVETPDPTPTTPVVVTPPTPVETAATIRKSFQPFRDGGKPIECIVSKNVMATDRLHNGHEITVNRYDRDGEQTIIHLFGTFQQGGNYYALVKVKGNPGAAEHYMYGIKINSRNDLRPYLAPIGNWIDSLWSALDSLYNKTIGQSLDGIFRAKKK